MLKIRLSRRGKKRQPSYRVVVADVNAKRDGRIVERIGHYNPLTDPSEFNIKEDRALHWLNVGAQPTDAVRRLLDKQGTFGRLGRMRAGEAMDVLVAEVTGEVIAAPEAVEEVAEVAETAVEEVVEAVEDAAEAVEEVIEIDDVVEEVAAEAVEEVVETGDVVEEVAAEAVEADDHSDEDASDADAADADAA
jgi:small subunit ribosomal protein S16